MIINEAGSSLSNKILGINNSTSTYYCQPEVYENKNIEQEFKEMLEHLKIKLGDNLHVDNKNYTITTEAGDKYKLCKVQSPNERGYRVSTITWAIKEEIFTKNMVYLQDENIVYANERTRNHIQDKYLSPVNDNDFYTKYMNDPSVLESIMTYVIKYDFTYGDYIDEVLRYSTPNEKFTSKALLEKLLKTNTRKTLNFIINNNLDFYIFDFSGLKLDVSLK